MNSYTEEEICAAMRCLGTFDPSVLILQLGLNRMSKKDHTHDWADNDMISAKEIRASWGRTFTGKDGGVFAEAASSACEKFLQDISEHREHFEENSVVQDPEGNIWKLRGRTWLIFGYGLSNASYATPRRPLKLLGVDARRG